MDCKKRKKKLNQYELNDDYACIVIKSKRHGVVRVKINKDDIGKCKQYTWGVGYMPTNKSLYCRTAITKPNKLISLHRFICDCLPNFIVDHINHDTLDNRKENLRICTKSINNSNKKGACKNNKLGVRNVRYSEKLDKYIVRVKQKHIGCYSDINEAIKSAEKHRNIMLYS